MATALKKKKNQIKASKASSKKIGKKKGKNKRETQVNGSFNHKAARATGGCYSDSSHLSLGKFSSRERVWEQRDGFGVHEDGGTDLGFVLTSCLKLCFGHMVFFAHLPHCNIPSEGANVTAKAELGF